MKTKIIYSVDEWYPVYTIEILNIEGMEDRYEDRIIDITQPLVKKYLKIEKNFIKMQHELIKIIRDKKRSNDDLEHISPTVSKIIKKVSVKRNKRKGKK